MKAIILLLAAILCCGGVNAAVPQTLNYQGYLTNSAGTPINGARAMTFRLYSASSGGAALWTEAQPSVNVVNGIFDTTLGSITPLPPLPFDVPYWLTVQISPDLVEMSPRQQVTASAYAIRAANADALAPTATVAGAQITGTVSDQQLSSNVALLDAPSNTFTGTLNVSTSFVVETRPNSSGSLNNFIGANAGAANTTGTANTFVGHNAGKANIGGSSNAFYGLNAGTSNTSGQLNVFIGQGSGAFNDSGSNNNFIGQAAGFNAFNGNSNNFFGWHAGFATASGNNNAFFGDQAGASNTASNNAYFGSGAGTSNTGGTQGSFFGINAGNKTTGSFNSFFGAGAGQFTTSGVGNTFVGNIAGSGNSTGSNNTFFGGNTGNSLTVESHNTLLGDTTDGAAGITNSTAIGANAKVTASNSLVLGSIAGVNGAVSDTNVGIGTTSPNSTLQVDGSISVAIRSTAASPLIALTATDYVLVVTGAGASNVGLPNPVAGRVYVVKNRSSGLITLLPFFGPATIDGLGSISIASPNGVAQVVSDGTNWFKMN
jgi:hypothetical protein